MKNLLFKSLINVFLIVSLCSLTACGGGGGSSDNGGNNKVTILDNTDYQIASIRDVINQLRGLFPNSSNRLNIKESSRAYLDQNFTGKDLLVLSYVDAEKIKTGYIINNPDTFADYKARIKNKKEIVNRNALDFIIADSGEYNIGFYNSWEGSSIRILSYFAIDKSETEIKGVSYIMSQDCMTFCYRITKDGIEGKTFKNDLYDVHYQSSKTGLITNVSGDTEKFTYGNNTDITY